MKRCISTLMLVAGLLGFVPGSAGAEPLPAAAPEAHGFDSSKLAEALAGIDASGLPVHSLLMVRGGEVLLDAYFYPYDGKSPHDVASVTKSVTTSLVAIAAAEGKLDLDATMVSFFPDLQIANRDARKERITVRQLTQNTSGLACIGYPEELTLAQMEASPDFVQFVLDLPMEAEPGTTFDYCSPGMHLLSAILTKATGQTALAYASEKLFGPLGIGNVVWDTDPQGITRGWGDLHLYPLEMARLGLLWLGGGSWEGRQVIPADWIKSATTAAIASDRYEDYGYGFWVGPENEPIPYFMASGRAGQRVLVAPPLELVIVTTGGGFDPGDIIDPVVGALADPGKALPSNPAGEARLTTVQRQVAAAPAPQPVPPLPAIAAQISGKTYSFPANPAGISSVRLDFPGGDEAAMTLVDTQGKTARPVGLDGVYRFSPAVNGTSVGVTGGWTDESTFVLDYNSIADIRSYAITTRHSGNTLEMTISQRDEALTIKLTGRAE